MPADDTISQRANARYSGVTQAAQAAPASASGADSAGSSVTLPIVSPIGTDDTPEPTDIDSLPTGLQHIIYAHHAANLFNNLRARANAASPSGRSPGIGTDPGVQDDAERSSAGGMGLIGDMLSMPLKLLKSIFIGHKAFAHPQGTTGSAFGYTNDQGHYVTNATAGANGIEVGPIQVYKPADSPASPPAGPATSGSGDD